MIIFRNKPNPAWWTTTAISFQRALDILEIIVIFVAIYFLFFWNPWNGKGGLLRHGIYDTEEVKKADADSTDTKVLTPGQLLDQALAGKDVGNNAFAIGANSQAQSNFNIELRYVVNGQKVVKGKSESVTTPPPPKEEGKKKDDDTIGGGGSTKPPVVVPKDDPWGPYKKVKIIAQTKTLTNGNGDGQNQAIIGRSDGCEGCD